jgi:hypothetical protein
VALNDGSVAQFPLFLKAAHLLEKAVSFARSGMGHLLDDTQ